MKRIGGLDPGSTTGICVLEYDPVKVKKFLGSDLSTWRIMNEVVRIGAWDQLGEDSPERSGIAAYDWFVECAVDVVVCEDFILYAGLGEGHTASADRAGLDPVRVTSAFLTSWILQGGGFPVHYQMAGNAKSMVTNERLKQAGMWRKGFGTDRGKHAADAVRHAVQHIRNEEF